MGVLREKMIEQTRLRNFASRTQMLPFGTALALVLAIGALAGCKGTAQAPAVAPSATPGTKLEGFKPAAGTIVTLGYEDLDPPQNIVGITAEIRQLRDSKNSVVKGLLLEITESPTRNEKAFVDADEIPELLKGIDALLAVRTNPTSFKNFEVRYTTRGGLELTTFNSSNGAIKYAVRAGRITPQDIDAVDMEKLRALFVAAQKKLSSGG
jgi:hypothetical protein